jgi:hypothetical protein
VTSVRASRTAVAVVLGVIVGVGAGWWAHARWEKPSRELPRSARDVIEAAVVAIDERCPPPLALATSVADQAIVGRMLGVLEGVILAFPNARSDGGADGYHRYRRWWTWIDEYSRSLRTCAPEAAAQAATWVAAVRTGRIPPV